MFSSNLSRGPFFLYTMLLGIIELVLIFGFIIATMGFVTFVHSKPGPGREGVALAVFVIEFAFAFCRANIAIRRNRDRNGSGKFIWLYVALLFAIALLTPFEFLVYKFGEGGSDNFGLAILNFISFVQWIRLLISGTQSLDGVDREIAELAKRYGGAETPQPQNFVASPAPSFTPSNGGATVFGKRR
jgi:uncharacterized membrane protein YhaH (DUF805 family)